MTKKDYIKIGKALIQVKPNPESVGAGIEAAMWGTIVDALCRVFREDNSAFKEDRFRDFVNGKCGPNGGAK